MLTWTLAAGLPAAVLLVGCTLGQRPPSERVCTLIGCAASLEVTLKGKHVPTDFTMTVNSPAGDKVNVHCTEGNAEFDPPEAARWNPACPAGGVTFQNFTPQQITVTVRWHEGETTQTLEPVYSDFQPNGPQCEPTCRSGRVDVLIPQIPAHGDSSTWETYRDEQHDFSFKYPAALGLEAGPIVDGNRVLFLSDKIRIQTSAKDPLVCQGECPMIEKTETLTIAGREARRVRGYIGSIGGNVPQYFLMYLIRLGNTFVSFQLFAESREASTDDPSYIRDLKEEDVDLFERIMQTVEFTR